MLLLHCRSPRVQRKLQDLGTEMMSVRYKRCSPKLSHAIQELFPAEHTLSGRSKLPRHHEDAHTSWVQHEVVAKLLDSINPYLVLILRVCRETYRLFTVRKPACSGINACLVGTHLCICCRAVPASCDPLRFSWILYSRGLGSESSYLSRLLVSSHSVSGSTRPSSPQPAWRTWTAESCLSAMTSVCAAKVSRHTGERETFGRVLHSC